MCDLAVRIAREHILYGEAVKIYCDKYPRLSELINNPHLDFTPAQLLAMFPTYGPVSGDDTDPTSTKYAIAALQLVVTNANEEASFRSRSASVEPQREPADGATPSPTAAVGPTPAAPAPRSTVNNDSFVAFDPTPTSRPPTAGTTTRANGSGNRTTNNSGRRSSSGNGTGSSNSGNSNNGRRNGTGRNKGKGPRNGSSDGNGDGNVNGNTGGGGRTGDTCTVGYRVCTTTGGPTTATVYASPAFEGGSCYLGAFINKSDAVVQRVHSALLSAGINRYAQLWYKSQRPRQSAPVWRVELAFPPTTTKEEVSAALVGVCAFGATYPARRRALDAPTPDCVVAVTRRGSRSRSPSPTRPAAAVSGRPSSPRPATASGATGTAVATQPTPTTSTAASDLAAVVAALQVQVEQLTARLSDPSPNDATAVANTPPDSLGTDTAVVAAAPAVSEAPAATVAAPVTTSAGVSREELRAAVAEEIAAATSRETVPVDERQPPFQYVAAQYLLGPTSAQGHRSQYASPNPYDALASQPNRGNDYSSLQGFLAVADRHNRG